MKLVNLYVGEMLILQTWKEKNLDYEIETSYRDDVSSASNSWKEKNLDYEIETWVCLRCLKQSESLEKKRTSITRLKPAKSTADDSLIASWKEKNLDYEIETVANSGDLMAFKATWKEKNLDYEIETREWLFPTAVCRWHLKRKEPRLRDWNGAGYRVCSCKC